jgi:hypothetical protein
MGCFLLWSKTYYNSDGDLIKSCECKSLFPTSMIDDTNNLFNTDRISSAFSGDALNTLKNFCLLYTLTVLRWIKYDMGILG